MAVDKLVDSTQLNTDLTSVANAIRTKGGTSEDLAFPAGFVSAVQAIPTGTTPTGTKQISITQNGTVTEDVAAYANAEITVNVQGGGGLPAILDKVDAGTATLATSSDIIEVSHNLGRVPDFACIYQDLSDWADVAFGVCVLASYLRFRYPNAPNETYDKYIYSWRYKHATSGNSLGSSSSMLASNATATTFKFSRGNSDWATVDANGNPVTYKWMVGTFKED